MLNCVFISTYWFGWVCISHSDAEHMWICGFLHVYSTSIYDNGWFWLAKCTPIGFWLVQAYTFDFQNSHKYSIDGKLALKRNSISFWFGKIEKRQCPNECHSFITYLQLLERYFSSIPSWINSVFFFFNFLGLSLFYFCLLPLLCCWCLCNNNVISYDGGLFEIRFD